MRYMEMRDYVYVKDVITMQKIEMLQVCTQIEAKVRSELDLKEHMADDEIASLIDQVIISEAKVKNISLSEKIYMKEHVFHALRGYDCLEDIMKEEDITEIMVNGYQRIFVERSGRLYAWEYGFSSEEKYMDVIQQIVGSCNRIVNESSPIVDARLPDGSRVNVVLPPIALDGAVMTIRRFPKETYSLEDLCRMGMISEHIKQVLGLFVRCKYNIMISGGTGSGKTTFLNALANQIPYDERIITIEDSAELKIRGIPNLVRMEVRNANVEGKNEIPMKELIKSALRMRPTRIIVGEVRGEEALQMLQAMNTGHSGSLSTGHANSARDILYRLETMVLMGMDMPLPAIRQQIASAIDLIVHIGRWKDGSRKVLEIAELRGIDRGEIRLEPLYVWEDHEWKGKRKLEQTEKIMEMGYWEDYQEICHI